MSNNTASTPVQCLDCPPSTSSVTQHQHPAPPPPPSGQDAAALDPSLFVPPILNQRESDEELPRVVVEFCDRCRVRCFLLSIPLSRVG